MERNRQLFAHIREELRLEKIELNRAETRVHTFIEFIASGRASPSLADALSQAEVQVKTLSADVQGMEAAKDQAFTPPPAAWITDRVGKLNHLLAKRTEKSALALRRLTGSVTLSPQKPEVGKPYYRASCKFDALNLLVEEGGSNLLHWWRRRESNPAKSIDVVARFSAIWRLLCRFARCWTRSVPPYSVDWDDLAAHGRHMKDPCATIAVALLIRDSETSTTGNWYTYPSAESAADKQ